MSEVNNVEYVGSDFNQNLISLIMKQLIMKFNFNSLKTLENNILKYHFSLYKTFFVGIITVLSFIFF